MRSYRIWTVISCPIFFHTLMRWVTPSPRGFHYLLLFLHQWYLWGPHRLSILICSTGYLIHYRAALLFFATKFCQRFNSGTSKSTQNFIQISTGYFWNSCFWWCHFGPMFANFIRIKFSSPQALSQNGPGPSYGMINPLAEFIDNNKNKKAPRVPSLLVIIKALPYDSWQLAPVQ